MGITLGLFGVLAAVAARPASAQNLTTENVGAAETEAGNIVADAVRTAGKAAIAFVPAAAFKPGASVPKPATGQQAAGLVEPADDRIVTLRLRGTQILAALERSVSFRPQRSAGFLQVSGLRFTYDTDQPGGKRVLSATVGGAALEAARTYVVATTKALASGQQGYFQIWDGRDAKDTGTTLAEALRQLGSARNGSLSAAPEGRIVARGR